MKLPTFLALATTASLAFAVQHGSARAGEIGWIENFALSADRETVLKQLIPGTEDYYFYHALHYQNTEQWEKVEQTLKAWVDRYNWTARAIEIQNRQALLTYQHNPQRALDLIRQRLNLQFNHQREELNQKPNLPTKLDPAQLAPKHLNDQAFAQFPNTIEGFADPALDWLVSLDLNAERRRQLLARLKRPDYPNLVKLVIDDLNHEHSGGFGQFEIHRQLLLVQLDECLKLKPDLRNLDNFVNAYLLRLRPSDDANWRQDRQQLQAYLERLWTFVKTLDPVHNSLKAHVLYHRLVLDRAQGKYDTARLMEYLKLPKQASYVQPKFLEAMQRRQHAANLQQDFATVTMLPPVGDDEPLVRSYLAQFFVAADDYKNYEPYVSDAYLKQVFAETKIVNGLGEGEKWYSLLPPEMYQQLKERIDLDFAFTNKTEFAADDPVSLDLYVKNVGTLIVKVFEINTQSFYRQQLKEVSTDINLDGLVANQEKTYRYQEPPLRRVRRHFEFAALNHRGVYVIDFIGNGKASRALVHKGRLRHLVRNSVAGQTFTVFDEQNQLVPQATLWLAGVLYRADKDGTITTPYSSTSSTQSIVLSAGGFSSLDKFSQHAESYHLAAAMYVDREELLARRTARLIVRTQLLLGGTPVSRKLLEDVRLVITSTDLDNVATSKEISDFKLFDDRDTTYEFQVPQRLARVQLMLKARVQHQSENRKIDLAAQQAFALNEIDRTDKTEDLHFARVGDDYVLDLLGKTGELRAQRPVQIELRLRDYTQPLQVSLQSDEQGRVVLGPLAGVISVSATGPQGTAHLWNLRRDEHTWPATLDGDTDQSVEVPYMGTSKKPDRAELSLLELRGDKFVTDRFANISIDGGLLHIDKLPPGDYSLLLKRDSRAIHLRLTAGPHRSGYILGDFRKLELRNPRPLQMQPVEVDDKTVRVKLQNVTPLARVHIFATRFEPAYNAYDSLARIASPEPVVLTTPRAESQYVAGRNIGDEYRYIIDRKFARKYPGNMLARPSLLLNPWAIRSTETGQQESQSGEDFAAAPPAPSAGYGGKAHAGLRGETAPSDFADLDFLAQSSAVVTNITPDKDGLIEIQRADLGPHQQLLFVAVDPQNTGSRIVTLPDAESKYLDLRLAKGLDPKLHFTQQKQISVLAAQDQLVVPDITSSRFEVYDSLARVYGLYATLGSDAKLIEFGFLRNWPTLKPDEKRAQYLTFASHELHFFLHEKDPEFFKTVVRPYLANKQEKQFLDHWLLDDDLTDYLKPWNFEQLNTFERALLGHRIAAQRAIIARLIKDQVDLLPPEPDRLNHLFQTAINGSSLDTNDRLGLLQQALAAKGGESPDFSSKRGMPLNLPASVEAQLNVNGVETDDKPAAAPAATLARGRADASGDLKKSLRKAGQAEKDMDELNAAADSEFLADERFKLDGVRQYYRKLDKTMEWVESNYYKLPLEQQKSALIAANAFWKDYSAHDPNNAFLSRHLAEASHNFPEMLMALAVLDLPFTSPEHESKFDAARMTFTAGGPVVVYHEEIQPAKNVAKNAAILISQNFFRNGDRYRQVDGEQSDKFVSDEFLVETVYGCQIVVTNPTSSKKKVDVLLQIPTGSLPVSNGQNTRSIRLDLDPYHTSTLEYYFYFPVAGKFSHYPVQVASSDEVLAFAAPLLFNVVKTLTNIDKQSWDYISQHGAGDDVLEFLKEQNLPGVNLERIAWRMQDKAFFAQAIGLLSARHIYNHVLWSYGVKHDDVAAVRQFLQFADDFVRQCGPWLDSPLLSIDPQLRKSYEQMDYLPLVNARVGQLGRKREILNDRFLSQYQRLLEILSYRRQPNDIELMAITYYLLLQDRVDEALDSFGHVEHDRLATQLQYDYFSAYLDFYKAEPKAARQIAVKYADYPVQRWRMAFADLVNQAEEIDKPIVKVANPEDRTQIQTSQAAATPAFDFRIEARQVKLNFQNLTEVQVNYYLMDIELLFSRNPFVQGDSRQFSNILPNRTEPIKLPAKGTSFELALPGPLASGNLLVEIVGAGQTKSQVYYSNALKVQLIENYGQVQITQGESAAPLPQVYVKAYARLKDGSVQFYKDGYTDLRGRFDYGSLSTNQLDVVDKFSLLILSDEYGAVVREANPPQR